VKNCPQGSRPERRRGDGKKSRSSIEKRKKDTGTSSSSQKAVLHVKANLQVGRIIEEDPARKRRSLARKGRGGLKKNRDKARKAVGRPAVKRKPEMYEVPLTPRGTRKLRGSREREGEA